MMKTSNSNYASELRRQVNKIEIFLLPFAMGGATLFGRAGGRGGPAPLLVKGEENV
jgi:hypothetical protein